MQERFQRLEEARAKEGGDWQGELEHSFTLAANTSSEREKEAEDRLDAALSLVWKYIES